MKILLDGNIGSTPVGRGLSPGMRKFAWFFGVDVIVIDSTLDIFAAGSRKNRDDQEVNALQLGGQSRIDRLTAVTSNQDRQAAEHPGEILATSTVFASQGHILGGPHAFNPGSICICRWLTELRSGLHLLLHPPLLHTTRGLRQHILDSDLLA